jgi:glutamyl-tRNA(Gln) amidotransferase subunit D
MHVTQNKNLPKINLLHTGGTIASKVDYKTGGVIADFDPDSLLSLFPELTDIAYIESEFLGNMFSDDFRFAHFNKIAKTIYEKALRGETKFVVTSGTDFLHYLSATLSFMLKDLPVNVLVVGSQRSSDRGSSDAGMNLICAAQFLASTDMTGVAVCMHANSSDDTCVIIPGTNARKMHSSRRDAFKSINTTPYAYVNYETKTVKLNKELPKKQIEEIKELTLLKTDLKIGLLYSKPNLFADEINMYQNFDGLVIAGSGLGHLPITASDDLSKENKDVENAITQLTKKIPVVMSTQTINGRVHMNVYAPGRLLQKIGVMGHLSNMTPETTYAKLAYLLSKETKNLNEELLKNYCGEQENNSFADFEE